MPDTPPLRLPVTIRWANEAAGDGRDAGLLDVVAALELADALSEADHIVDGTPTGTVGVRVVFHWRAGNAHPALELPPALPSIELVIDPAVAGEPDATEALAASIADDFHDTGPHRWTDAELEDPDALDLAGDAWPDDTGRPNR